MLSRALAFTFLLSTVAPFTQSQTTPDKPILGFASAEAAKERELESQFDAKLNRDDLRAWMKRLSARPNHIGSAYDKENAEFLASLFRSWGFDTRIEEFDVLFPTPKSRLLEMTGPERFTAKLIEPALAQDATSGQASEQLPVYNAYSIDGDVSGDLVYVNFGVPRDYEELERRGIDVKGKIVIARYGGSWRGIKPKVAAEHGAVGCIIYSDPHEDGYFEGDVYPKGPYRSENGAQRGSVMDMPIHPGDPLTPGFGATKDAKRIDRKDAEVITKIPVLPISYSDALPLLRALGGPMAPQAWRGALPIPYHLGPGPARIHLRLEFDWKMVTIRDVIARMTGNERPDEWVMRGNHYDAWVNGAQDPISGLVSELAEARAIGELAKSGWRPKRTILFAAWDGEEEGLLGSTEWAETHGDELQKNLAVYINSDSNGRGFLQASGSHTLERFVTQVARDVVDPERGVSVLERLRARQQVDAAKAVNAINALAAANGLNTKTEDRKDLWERPDLRIAALGSGSDYSVFLQHLGIASLDVGYGGEASGGSYHSIYDSFDHFTRFVDPKFEYGIAQTQTTGRMTLRLVNAGVLPFEVTDFADTVSRYASEVAKLSDEMRSTALERNRLVEEHAYELAADPTETYVPPKPATTVPHLELAPLNNAVAHLQTAAKALDHVAVALPSTAVSNATIDRALMHLEQLLTRPDGLPRRPWYRHQVYAPGFYTGYGVKTLPGAREAIEQKNWTEANQQVVTVAKLLENYAGEIDRIAGMTRGKSQ